MNSLLNGEKNPKTKGEFHEDLIPLKILELHCNAIPVKPPYYGAKIMEL